MQIGNGIGTAVNALYFYRTRLNESAQNIANAFSDGVRPAETAINQSGTGLPEIPEIDLAGEMVNLIVSADGFKANLKVIQSEDEIMKSIIDIIG